MVRVRIGVSPDLDGCSTLRVAMAREVEDKVGARDKESITEISEPRMIKQSGAYVNGILLTCTWCGPHAGRA